MARSRLAHGLFSRQRPNAARRMRLAAVSSGRARNREGRSSAAAAYAAVRCSSMSASCSQVISAMRGFTRRHVASTFVGDTHHDADRLARPVVGTIRHWRSASAQKALQRAGAEARSDPLAIWRSVPFQSFSTLHEPGGLPHVVFGSRLMLAGALHHLDNARFAFLNPVCSSAARRRWRLTACHWRTG
jgi:hypothetical protein